MNMKQRVALITGSVLVTGGLLTGAALAATDTTVPTPTAIAAAVTGRLEQAVADGKITQAEADVLKQIQELRASVMEKLKTDSQAIIDQAVTDGKITQEQADSLKTYGGHGFKGHGGLKGLDLGFDPRGLTEEELKAKLDEAVAAGTLTQEQADQILSGDFKAGGMRGGKGGRGYGKGDFFQAPSTDESQDTEAN